MAGSDKQRVTARFAAPTQASCSPLSISGASAPGSLEAVRIYRRAVFSPRQWSAHPQQTKVAGDAKTARMRDPVTITNTKSGFCDSISHAASSAGYRGRKENLECKAWWWRCGPLLLHQLKRGVFQQHHRRSRHFPPCSNPTSAPAIRSGGSLSSDPRGSQKKPVQFVERVMTRVHNRSLAVILFRQAMHCLHKTPACSGGTS